MSAQSSLHTSVLLDRCLTLFTPAFENVKKYSQPVFVDATLGLGGHSYALLQKFSHLRVVGIDRDFDAIAAAKNRLAEFENRVHYVQAIYNEIPEVLDSLGITAINGILFDLGVSSMQLDHSQRGFSYSHEAPLDMRMDQSAGLSAAHVLTTYSREDLIRVIRNYGEEKFATRIVDNIIKAREKGALTSTTDLATLIKESIPAPARRTGGNPAKRTFQAIRIEVNNELALLEAAIPRALSRLVVGGRMVVMSFQSLEDKIVKKFFAELTESKTPRGLPVELAQFAAKFALVFRGSQSATDVEVTQNPRSQSVRLRAIERLAM